MREKRKDYNIIRCTIVLLFLIFLEGCSSNPQIIELDGNSLRKISLIPSLEKDVLEVCKKSNDDCEIHLNQLSGEDQYIIQNRLVYYYTENTQIIKNIIEDLKKGIPNSLSVFGASYGLFTFRLETIDVYDNRECFKLIPTSGVKKAFYNNRNSLEKVVLQKYVLQKKEKAMDLFKDLESKNILWSIEGSGKLCEPNEMLLSYIVLLEFPSIESYKDAQSLFENFLIKCEGQVAIQKYFVDKQTSSTGYPISVHLLLKNENEVETISKITSDFLCKFYYKPEPLEIFLPISSSPTLKKLIADYNLVKQ